MFGINGALDYHWHVRPGARLSGHSHFPTYSQFHTLELGQDGDRHLKGRTLVH